MSAANVTDLVDLVDIVDIGVNLTSKQFRGDLDAVIARARAAGVSQMIVTGLSAPVSWRASELARRYPGVLACTAGVHPHNAGRADRTTLAELRRLAPRPEVVAIGEMGLDFNRDFSPRAVQRRLFAQQLELAAEAGKPVFLHERDAHAEFVAIMREHRAALTGGVVHCFTSSAAALEAYLELDLHIGITGYICDDRRGRHLAELVASIPANRLMIETDAPFLQPRDLEPRPSSRRNEPAVLPHVLRRVARCRGESPVAVAAQTSANARRFFSLDQVGGAVVSPSGSVRSASGSVGSPYESPR